MRILGISLSLLLLSTQSFAGEDFRLQDPWVGGVYSSESAEWIDKARKITQNPSQYKFNSHALYTDLLYSGKQELDLVLLQLGELNSLDLMDLVKTPLAPEPSNLISQADRLVVDAIRNFSGLRADSKNLPQNTKISLQKASPFSFYQVTKEAKELRESYVNIAVTSAPDNAASLLYKFQLLESFSARPNIKEVWTFYDENSWKLLQRAQAGLVLGRALSNFTQSHNPFAYLYRASKEAKANPSESLRAPASADQESIKQE